MKSLRDRIAETLNGPVPQQPCPFCAYDIVVYYHPEMVARCARCEAVLPLIAREAVRV